MCILQQNWKKWGDNYCACLSLWSAYFPNMRQTLVIETKFLDDRYMEK